MLNLEIIKKELAFCYPEMDFTKYSEHELIETFNQHCNDNKEIIEIKDLIDNYKDTAFVLDTPDGFQEIGDFYVKPEIDIYKVSTKSDYNTKCASNHKFETKEGWKFAKDITYDDYILTKKGYEKVIKIENLNPEIVYDFEVLHENHRYWSGNGLSSHNTGKTYVALSMCRMAQKMGYDILYCDSEGAIDIDTVKRIGVDASRFIIQPVTTVQEFSHFSANLVKAVKEETAAGKVAPKFMVILDSLGNLSTTKEKDDMISGSGARDMTKQQQIRGMFRVVGNDFAKLGIPFVVNNHVYECIFGDNEVLMSDGSYKLINEIVKGDLVQTMEGDKEVLNTFEHDTSNYYELTFEDGTVLKCTPNHKLLVIRNNKEEWVEAVDLLENDEIIQL